MLQIEDNVRILGHPQGLFYGQVVPIRKIDYHKPRKTWYCCDVQTKNHVVRPSWFARTEIQKVQ